HSLNNELFPYFSRALVLLAKFRTKRTVAEFNRGAQTLHGFQFLQSTTRLNVLGNDFINGLRGSLTRSHCKYEERGQEELAHLDEFRGWSRTDIYFHAFPQEGCK